VGEHFFEAFLAGGGEAVVATRRAGRRGDLPHGNEAVVGESCEDGVEGGFGEGEAVASGEALQELVAVDFLLAECGKDEEFDEALAELGDPGAVGVLRSGGHATS
jgi:hypothetical protein